MSVQVIIIDKLGNKKEKKTKNYNELYKVCGYRNDNNFCKRNTWSVKIDKFTVDVELWAKKDGKANFENKYEFPPPVDKELYFPSKIDQPNNIKKRDIVLPDCWYKSLY